VLRDFKAATYTHFLLSAFLGFILLCVFLRQQVSGQSISIGALNSTYIQDFNALANSGSSAILPNGWYLSESGTSSNSTYSAGTGSGNTGDTYSFGSVASTERALGGLRSANLNPTYGAKFTNSTGVTISSLSISYRGEEWRLGALARNDRIDFQYSLNATSLITGTWIDENNLDFSTPNISGVIGALDGNLALNSLSISYTISGLTIPGGSSFWIRWQDFDPVGADDGLAIDDFELTAISPCNVTITSFTPSTGPSGTIVTITGNNFTGTTAVLFNGIASIFNIVNNNTITATVPVGATTGTISVINGCTGFSVSYFVIIDQDCSGTKNLILSELCEPANNYQTDRYIEIYNPTSSPVNLAGWSVRAISNGSISSLCSDAMTLCWNLSGIINPGQALTCGYTAPVSGVPHTFTHPEWITTSATNLACFNWNGQRRDGAALYNGTTRIDAVLRENSSTNWYGNSSLVRLSSICSPDPNASYLDWSVSPVSDAGVSPSTPRSHTSSCSGTSPLIITQPISQTVCQGSSTSFTVAANSGSPPYNYQWYVLNTATWTWDIVSGSNYSGTISSVLLILNIPLSFNGYQYYCRVSNQSDGCYVASNAVHLTVNPSPTAIATSNSPFCEPGTLQLNGGATGGSSPYAFAWSGPASFVSGSQNPSVSVATTLNNGLYKLTVTDNNGCTGKDSTYVSITALPATPTLSPDPVCEGTNPEFSAGGGSIYEFTLNGSIVQAASADNTWQPVAALAAGDQVCVNSLSPFVFDGIFESNWGNPLVTSAGGPASEFGNNNIDALYLQVSNGFLFGGIAGRLVDNSGNKVFMFIDCQPGGINWLGNWVNRNNTPPYYNGMKNLYFDITFDVGFNSDYILGINQFGGDVEYDLYNMNLDVNNYLGNQNSSSLLGYSANSGTGDYSRGFEFAIPLSALGNPTGSVLVFLMVVNEPIATAATFVSNQFLTRANAGEHNYGNGSIHFENAAPNPVKLQFSLFSCLGTRCITVGATPITDPITHN